MEAQNMYKMHSTSMIKWQEQLDSVRSEALHVLEHAAQRHACVFMRSYHLTRATYWIEQDCLDNKVYNYKN